MKSFLEGVSPQFIRSRVGSYLRQTGRLEKQRLGSADAAPEPPVRRQDNRRLDASLGSARRLQDQIFKLCFIILLAVLATHAGLILLSLATRNPVAGGLSLAVWPVVALVLRWLRQLWKDSVKITTLREILRDFPAAEAARIIEALYRGPMFEDQQPGSEAAAGDGG